MHKIDGYGATVDNQFTEGSPGPTPVPPTYVTDDWLNAVQGEIVKVVEEAGLALDKADNTQLLQSIRFMTRKRYLVDPTVADQGAVTVEGDRSIADHLAAIGTTARAIIAINHNGASDETVYFLNTNISCAAYPNVAFDIEPGAVFDRVTGDETITFYNPASLMVGGGQKLTTANMIRFQYGGRVRAEWWGASADDAADCYNAINYAMESGRGSQKIVVKLFPGVYRVSASPTMQYGSIALEGSGRRQTTLKTTSATAHIFTIDAGAGIISNSAVRNLLLDSTVAKTAGAAVRVLSTTGQLFSLDLIDLAVGPNCFHGIDMDCSAFFTKIANFQMTEVSANAIGISISGVGDSYRLVDTYMHNIQIQGGTPASTTIGVNFANFSEGVYATRIIIGDSLDYGLFFNNSDGASTAAPKNMFFSCIVTDALAKQGVYISDALTIRLTDVWATTCLGGFQIGSAATDIEVKGCMIINNQQHGVDIKAGAKHIRFLGGVVDVNSGASPGTYHGIMVQAGVSYFQIKDLDFSRLAGSGARHGYDVYVAAGASDYYFITGNVFDGNVSGGLNDGGTGTNKVVTPNV